MNQYPWTPSGTFRFRAEFRLDALMFWNALPSDKAIRYTLIQKAPFPDQLCEIQVHDLDLDQLRQICRSIPDGHVMLQTLQPAAAYTGERNYTLA
jgi:hypothetical protein